MVKRPESRDRASAADGAADVRLMKRVTRGNREARIALVRRLWSRVHARARFLSPFPDEVDDLVQESMLEILRSAPRFGGEGTLEAWAGTIATRTILRKLRTRRRHEEVLSPAEPDDVVDESLSDPERQSRDRALDARVTALLYELDPDQRVAMVLKTVHGHTVDEVADLMERKVDSVRYLLRRGRARLRKLALADPAIAEMLASWRET